MESRSSDPNHNLVSVLMHERGISAQEAVDHIGERFKQLTGEFMLTMMHLPELPESVRTTYAEFVLDIAVWVEGHTQWSFVSERYFGKKGMEVREKKIVEY